LDVVSDAPSSASASSIAFEEDFTTTEINTEQPVSLGSEVEGESTTENIFEEDTSDDYFEEEVMITETATHRPEEETLSGVSLPETSAAEGDSEDSGASEELNTLRPETFEERLTTTENIYEETVTAQTTTTIPDEEKQTDQPTIIDIQDSASTEELNTLRPETFEELPEHLTTTENIYEETATAHTTTTIPDEEQQTDQPTIIDIQDSAAPEELNTLPPKTIEKVPEHLITTENIYEETATDQTTTTIPDEEQQTDQSTIIEDKEEQSEFSDEQTTAASKGDTSTEEPTTPKIANEVIELMDEEDKEGNYSSTTEEVPVPSTMRPSTETQAPVTTDFSAEDPKTSFLDDLVITDRPAIEEKGSANTDETLVNTTEVNVEDFTKEPETSTSRPEVEQSTTIRVDSEELFVTDQTPNFNGRTKEIISEESLSEQDSSEVEIQTTTSKFDEGVSTEPSEAIQSNFTIDEPTPEPIMEQTIGKNTSRTNQPEDIRDDLTTEQPTKVIMTHMYVMQERKNSTIEESNNRSNEIQVDVQPETSSVSTSNPFDLLGDPESINDNIIFDTSEIFPVKAPEEEEFTERDTNVDVVSRVEDPRISLEEIGDHFGTSYRTEKSISRVVTEISV